MEGFGKWMIWQKYKTLNTCLLDTRPLEWNVRVKQLQVGNGGLQSVTLYRRHSVLYFVWELLNTLLLQIWTHLPNSWAMCIDINGVFIATPYSPSRERNVKGVDRRHHSGGWSDGGVSVFMLLCFVLFLSVSKTLVPQYFFSIFWRITRESDRQTRKKSQRDRESER